MTLGMEVDLGPGHSVLHGDAAPLPQKGVEPPISGPFYCGQTAGCIKMPLGVEVGLSLGDFVLDGDPALLPQKGQSPQFSISSTRFRFFRLWYSDTTAMQEYPSV